jgi:hypothetical protein
LPDFPFASARKPRALAVVRFLERFSIELTQMHFGLVIAGPPKAEPGI